MNMRQLLGYDEPHPPTEDELYVDNLLMFELGDLPKNVFQYEAEELLEELERIGITLEVDEDYFVERFKKKKKQAFARAYFKALSDKERKKMFGDVKPKEVKLSEKEQKNYSTCNLQYKYEHGFNLTHEQVAEAKRLVDEGKWLGTYKITDDVKAKWIAEGKWIF